MGLHIVLIRMPQIHLITLNAASPSVGDHSKFTFVLPGPRLTTHHICTTCHVHCMFATNTTTLPALSSNSLQDMFWPLKRKSVLEIMATRWHTCTLEEMEYASSSYSNLEIHVPLYNRHPFMPKCRCKISLYTHIHAHTHTHTHAHTHTRVELPICLPIFVPIRIL